jgi:hypothetical protein
MVLSTLVAVVDLLWAMVESVVVVLGLEVPQLELQIQVVAVVAGSTVAAVRLAARAL